MSSVADVYFVVVVFSTTTTVEYEYFSGSIRVPGTILPLYTPRKRSVLVQIRSAGETDRSQMSMFQPGIDTPRVST